MTGSGAEGKHGSIIRAEARDSEGLPACFLFSSFNLNKACGAGHFSEAPRKVRLQLGFCLLSSIFVWCYLLYVEDFNISLPQNNTGLSNPELLWCTQGFEIFGFE